MQTQLTQWSFHVNYLPPLADTIGRHHRAKEVDEMWKEGRQKEKALIAAMGLVQHWNELFMNNVHCLSLSLLMYKVICTTAQIH